MITETILANIWITDSPFIWVLLEVFETGMYFYLIAGILPDIKTSRKIQKIILCSVFVLMAGGVGMKYRIGSIFSSVAFFYGILVLIAGTWIVYRKNFLLITGIVMTYSAFLLLLVNVSAFVLFLMFSGRKLTDAGLILDGERLNEVFCILRLTVLVLLLPFLHRIRHSGIFRQIQEYRNLLLIIGGVLSVLVVEYQNFLEYGFYYLPAGIPAVTSLLRDSLLSLFTSVALGAAAGMLFFKNREICNENAFLLMKGKMEQQKYNEISEAVEKKRELMHDTKNHYLVINEYIRKKDYESLENYMSDLQENFIQTDSWVYTGNHILDLILGQKQIVARKKGIQFELQATPLSELIFDDWEICSLFGNLLDNAVEACERAKENTEKTEENCMNGRRESEKIKVKIEQKKKLLFIQIVNSTDRRPRQKDRRFITRKTDSALHGYGLKSVERIVEDHGGVIFYDSDDRYFTVTITFFDIEKHSVNKIE